MRDRGSAHWPAGDSALRRVAIIYGYTPLKFLQSIGVTARDPRRAGHALQREDLWHVAFLARLQYGSLAHMASIPARWHTSPLGDRPVCGPCWLEDQRLLGQICDYQEWLHAGRVSCRRHGGWLYSVRGCTSLGGRWVPAVSGATRRTPRRRLKRRRRTSMHDFSDSQAQAHVPEHFRQARHLCRWHLHPPSRFAICCGNGRLLHSERRKSSNACLSGFDRCR